MTTILILAVLLAVYLPGVVILHRSGHRRAEQKARRQLPTQGIALRAVLTTLFLALSALVTIAALGGIPLAWCIWAAVVLSGMGYCYWLLVCITESARRYIIADMIANQPGITPDEIVSKYNRYQIIAARLERLEHWGTLKRNNDYYLAHPTLMLAASVLVRSWAQVLGFAWPQGFRKKTSHS